VGKSKKYRGGKEGRVVKPERDIKSWETWAFLSNSGKNEKITE